MALSDGVTVVVADAVGIGMIVVAVFHIGSGVCAEITVSAAAAAVIGKVVGNDIHHYLNAVQLRFFAKLFELCLCAEP